MKRIKTIENLKKYIQHIERAELWLKRSYDMCQNTGIKSEYSPEEYDAFETLTSRFARVCDILIHKVYRAIDAVEMESGGTMIDVVNRAHKRELFEDVDEIRKIKDLRNEVAHEYIEEELLALFYDIFQFTPKLLEYCENAKKYCKKKQLY